MAILLPIDHGNDSIKTENFRFRSGLAMHTVKPPMSDEVLEYNNRYYTLSSERFPYMRDKTQDDRFFVLTLFSIAKEILKNGDYSPVLELDLGVGLPPEHFGVLRDRFESYFKRGKVNFIYNSKPFCIIIRHVVVCPQGYAAVLALDQELAELPSLFIIDGGGYTVDIGLLQYGIPDMKFNRSLEAGTIIMYNEISRLVGSKHDMLINEERILSVLQGKGSDLLEDVVNTIKAASNDHANDILYKLREIRVDLRSNPCVMMGGLVDLFVPVYKESSMILSPRFVTDPQCNVKGIKLMARNKIQKLSA